MIWSAHLLLGDAIGSKIQNIPLALLLAFLSHYILDVIPHIEYPIKNIENKKWGEIFPDILKIILDFCLGIFFIFIFSKNQPIVYLCAFMAILPDVITGLNHLFPNKIFALHDKFHKKIHFLKNKKIPVFWRIASQISVVIISIILINSHQFLQVFSSLKILL